MKRIKRIILLFQLYALDITISGQDECLECVSDPSLHFRITAARINARTERARLRSEYNALLPVGKSITWSIA